MAEMTYIQAISDALRLEMRRDPRVFLMGEDVGVYGGAFKVSQGFQEEFGPWRVIDTPLSETAIVGGASGAALMGLRPVAEMQFADFISCAWDHLVTVAAKQHFRGRTPVPIVVRLPSGPYEAKGLMKTAIRDEGPVVIFEDKMMYRVKGPVPAEDYTIPFGVAEVRRPGRDITIVATSSMVQVALDAATLLEEIGISAEVIDPRTTAPLDKQALIDSAKKTSRAIVVDEGYERYGVTAEIASVIAEGAFYHLDAPVKRIGAMDVPVPFSPVLEDLTVPSSSMVFEAAKALCRKA